ncbi:MAG: TatD family hydrolase [Candidatus Omnitrophica bacterium]|nr:TatD family hydrolase [Candidatus Omnitrophota bacterium]
MFVDTHVHLHFPDYNGDRQEVIRRSRDAGVKLFINVGTDLKSSEESLKLAEENEDIYATVGIHPHDAKDAKEEDFRGLAELLEKRKVVAIGEVGLDFFRNLSPPEIQKKVLSRFFDFYKKTKKTLILHIRDAYKEMKEQVKSELGQSAKGILHCFSSDKETMKEFLDLGFHISFAGPLTYKKNDTLREAFQACPLDRLLLETDAPFLPPQSMRGKRNESGFLIETAQLGAQLKKISLEKLGEMTTENAKRIFSL